MQAVEIIGRILFGGFFLMMGLNHFMKMRMMTQYAKSKNVPAPKLASIGTGILLVLGGISYILWEEVIIGSVLLLAFLFFTTVFMHQFWRETDPQAKMREMVNFMKNMALLGSLLIILAFITTLSVV